MGAGTLSQPAQRRVSRPGIVAALPGEARALARLRAQGRATLAGGAQLALSGLGAARAAAAARALVADGVDGLVSWGTATALVPSLAAGDLLLPREIVAADGQIRSADPAWLAHLTDAIGGDARIRHGVLAETRHMLVDGEAKRALHAASQALAADMESVAVVAVAAEFELPFVAVRAIADEHAMTVSRAARAALDDSGALRPVRLLAALAYPPRELHGQLRMLKQLAVSFRAAQRTLARAAPHLSRTDET